MNSTTLWTQIIDKLTEGDGGALLLLLLTLYLKLEKIYSSAKNLQSNLYQLKK